MFELLASTLLTRIVPLGMDLHTVDKYFTILRILKSVLIHASKLLRLITFYLWRRSVASHDRTRNLRNPKLPENVKNLSAFPEF